MSALFVFGLVVGLVVGGAGMGILANRRPQWFAHVVTLANAVDTQVNTIASATTAHDATKV